MENYLWFFSTVAQVFAALWAVTGMFAVYRLGLLDRKIKDALFSLLNFIFARFKSNTIDAITQEYIRILNNIKEHIIGEVEEDKKEYFELDSEILLNKVTETKYIIDKYTSHLKKVSEDIEKQKREERQLLPEEKKEQVLKEKTIKKYQTFKDIYRAESNYKNDLITDLTMVTIVDGLIVGSSLVMLFCLDKPLLLKIKPVYIQIPVFLASLFATILSAKFILDYCKRR